MKRILGGLVLLLCIFGFVLYQFFGGRYWVEMSKLVMKNPDATQRSQLQTKVWGKERELFPQVVALSRA